MGSLAKYNSFTLCSIVFALVFLIPRSSPADQAQPVPPTLDQLRQEVVAAPTDASAYDTYGVALMKSTQNSTAVTELQFAVQLAPNNEQFQLDLAAAQQASGAGKDAFATLTGTIKQFPGSAIAEIRLSQLYDDYSEHSYALQCLAAAENADPTSVLAHYELGEALLADGKLPDAEKEFNTCIQMSPIDSKGYFALATAQQVDGHVPDSIATLSSLISAGSLSRIDESAAHVQLATLYLQTHKNDLAVAELRKAVVLTPDDPMAHNALGAALMADGNCSGALAEWRTALKSKDPSAQQEAHDWISSMSTTDSN